MADGSGVLVHGRIIGAAEAAGRALNEALGQGHIVSRCSQGCGHVQSVDVSEWRDAGEGRFLLSTLARRLRCACGARDVRLEIWPLAPITSEVRIYLWP